VPACSGVQDKFCVRMLGAPVACKQGVREQGPAAAGTPARWRVTAFQKWPSVMQEIESLKDNNEAWSLDVQNKWRYVVIAGGRGGAAGAVRLRGRAPGNCLPLLHRPLRRCAASAPLRPPSQPHLRRRTIAIPGPQSVSFSP